MFTFKKLNFYYYLLSYLSLLNRTALTEDGKVISNTNFLEISSYNISVLSANFGLEPPDAIASIFVRYNISHTDMLPIASTSGKYNTC